MLHLKIRGLFSDKAQKEFYFKAGGLEPHTKEFGKAFDSAFDAARVKEQTAPFAAFAEGYITKRRLDGETERNGRYDKHISRPLLMLMERSDTPREVVKAITSQMPPPIQKIMLDFTLRLACESASAETITSLINSGADINAEGGHPLHKAIIFDNLPAIHTLNERGVDWEQIPPFYDRYDQKAGRPAYIEKRDAIKATLPVVKRNDSAIAEAMPIRRPLRLKTPSQKSSTA